MKEYGTAARTSERLKMSDLLARLQTICGPDHVSDVLADRICYRRDCGPTPSGVPDIVVRPESTAEVVEIVKLANQVRKPIFLWGRATTFVDHGVREGCIVMALDLMNRVLKIDLENQVVTAEAGAIWHAVDSELNKLGWEMTVPGGGGMFSCTVGGTVAYNAVPHGITEYGVTGGHVVTLEVVLPDGTILRTGSAANTDAPLPIERGANGPDLAGLFIGSCGTLGVITEVTLRIHRIPECERFLFYAFDRLDDAVDAASAIQSQQAATFLVGLFGGPKPAGVDGEAFLHAIIRATAPSRRNGAPRRRGSAVRRSRAGPRTPSAPAATGRSTCTPGCATPPPARITAAVPTTALRWPVSSLPRPSKRPSPRCTSTSPTTPISPAWGCGSRAWMSTFPPTRPSCG